MSTAALTSSAAWRFGLGLLVCVPLIAATIAVEWPQAQPVASAALDADRPVLELICTAPVTRWQVRIGDHELTPLSSDRQQWRGVLDAPAGSVVRIQVETAHPGTPRALRARIGSLPERSAWSEDELTLMLTVPAH